MTLVPRERAALRGLDRARYDLLRKYPRHAGIIARWQPVAVRGVGSIGVTRQDDAILLLFDPDFVLGLERHVLVGVLHHELNHVLFGHLSLGGPRYMNQKALRVATEVTANEYVPEDLPGQPLLLRDFPFLPPDEDTQTRYHRLAERFPGDSWPDWLPDVATLDNHDVWPWAPPIAAASRGGSMRLMGDPGGHLSLRRLFPGRSRSPRVTVPVKRGTGTLNWRTLLAPHLPPPPPADPCFTRPPRRCPQMIGIVPVYRRAEHRARIMAVVDTSSSMTEVDFAKISGELASVARDHSVTVVECDVRIGRVYPFDHELKEVSGRRGTDLRPPFARRMLDRLRPDLAIYFTDGGGTAPSRPPAITVVWCLTPDGTVPAKWGVQARMK